MNPPESAKAVHSDFISRTMNKILATVSDDYSRYLLKKIAENNSHQSSKEGCSTEQRNRISSLVKAGLIEESNGKLGLTPMGTEMWGYVRILAFICSLYPRLQLVDIVSSMKGMPKSELTNIIDTLIKDSNISDVLKEDLNII